MTGLKSGSGDDLWGDDADTTDDESDQNTSSESSENTTAAERSAEPTTHSDTTERSSNGVESSGSPETTSASTSSSGSRSDSRERRNATSGTQTQDEKPHSYIVRRAIQDKSVQFERDERLTFFVHDDVIEGERDLITDLESTLGRDIPKFDVREAVYRAALRNQDDVLEELLSMGYSQE